MNTIKVAINGFGRIGRLAFRLLCGMKGIDIVAVNDLTSPASLADLLKYDTAQGRFHAEVKAGENSIIINGDSVPVYAHRDPAHIPWKDHDVDIVLECTGYFADKDKASAHLTAGARKVLISTLATGDLKTIVYNINHHILDGTETIISCATDTTHSLAPMARVLDDRFGILNAMLTTIHAYTNDQNIQDAPHPSWDLKRARAAAHNIVIGDSSAGRAIGMILPGLRGKIDGSALRVPAITGSLTELTSILRTKLPDDDIEAIKMINAAMKVAVNESFGYTEDPIVSSDVIGTTFGSLFDATQTKVQTVGNTQLVRTVAWYDNEMSYVSQLVRTLKYFAERI